MKRVIHSLDMTFVKAAIWLFNVKPKSEFKPRAIKEGNKRYPDR